MGKVLRSFTNGYPGAVSRSVDNVIISMKNGSGAAIPFGAPVFLIAGDNSCRGFAADSSTAANFLGFAVRAADKTPDTYGSSDAVFAADDPVDILVRGSTVLRFANNAVPGASVYVRKSDGSLMTSSGAEGSTIQLPNVTVRTARDENDRAEVVITKRNLM